MFKIVTKPREQKDALNEALKQRFYEKDFFKAMEKFEDLKGRKSLRVLLYDGNGKLIDNN